MGLRFSASKTGLLFGCRYPFRSDIGVPADVPSEASERGTRVHAAIDGGPDVPAEEQGYVDAAKRWQAANFLAADWRVKPRSEVALWWNGGTKRGEAKLDGRTYSGGPEHAVYGTADLLDETPTRRWIWDYKTSDRSAWKAEPQLLTLAVIANADGYGAIELRADGTYQEHHIKPLDPWDADEHARKLIARLASVEGSKPEPGDHCSDYYCPLRGTCPVYVEVAESAVQLIAPTALVRRKVTDPIVDGEGLGEALSFLELLGNWVDAKKREAKAFCDSQGGEVRISPTHVYHAVPTKRHHTSVERLTALARKRGATDEDLLDCESEKTTPTYRRQAKAERKSA